MGDVRSCNQPFPSEFVHILVIEPIGCHQG
jgi:hypothetical protein